MLFFLPTIWNWLLIKTLALAHKSPKTNWLKVAPTNTNQYARNPGALTIITTNSLKVPLSFPTTLTQKWIEHRKMTFFPPLFMSYPKAQAKCKRKREMILRILPTLRVKLCSSSEAKNARIARVSTSTPMVLHQTQTNKEIKNDLRPFS